MPENSNLSVCFFFPYHEVSGVPVLFTRMAEYISKAYGIKTYLIDYADGYMSRNLNPGSRVTVMRFEDGVPLHIGPDTILVMQSVLPYTMRSELEIHPDTRIVFWTLHPLNLIQTLIPVPFFRHLQSRSVLFHRFGMRIAYRKIDINLRKLVISMHLKKSLLFMDGSTLHTTTRWLGASIDDPSMVPVPSDMAAVNLRRNNPVRPKQSLQVCWIGRLADFKIHILAYTVEKLRHFAEKNKFHITMNVVGDGPEAGLLQRFKTRNEFFDLNLVGVLSKQELDEFLTKKVDLLAAMGTSALEGARVGVPTILLDVSYGPVREGYKFRWLIDADNFTLGDVIDSRHYEQGNETLASMIQTLLSDYDGVSQRTFDYYSANHSIESVGKKFVAAIAEGSFKYHDFSPEIFRKGGIRRVYECLRSQS